MGISIKIENKGVIKRFEQMETIPEKLIERAYRVFKQTTPIRSGNARRNTFLDTNNLEISAEYPYAGRLDEGYSKQAPRGMTEPTISYIERNLKGLVEK